MNGIFLYLLTLLIVNSTDMKIRLFFFCLLFTQLFIAQNSWEILNPKPSSGNNKAIAFSGGTGFIINNEKQLLFTIDSGETWTIKQTITSGNAISFSANVGFIVGDQGSVLKSVDFGATWVSLNIGATENLNSVSIIGDTVFISSDKKLFISTDTTNFTTKNIDIANSWVTKSVFTTSTEGHIFSQGKVYKTTDSGTTWTLTLGYYSTPNDINLFYFKNKNEGYINFGHGEFRKTIDGGETWINVPGSWFYSINSMYFVNDNTGFAVGRGFIYKTIDNGATWIRYQENFAKNSEVDFKSISFLNQNVGSAVANDGVILKTNNGGATWTRNSFTYDAVKEIKKIDDLFYVQAQHDIYKSADKITWQKLTSPTLPDDYPYIVDFQMVTANIGYALVGTAGSSNLSKTVDGGQTWTMIPNTYGGGRQLQFLNENIGYRTDSDIYKTTDGGITWVKITSPFYYNVYFVNENLAFGMRDSSLHRSTDGGTTWDLISGEEYVASYQFINAEEGFIAGNNAFLKTKDGGLTWEKIPMYGTYQYVNFQTSNIGYLSGQYNENHVYTDNGGATWNSISKPFPDISRFVIDKQLYIGGTHGKLAATNLTHENVYLSLKAATEITAQKAKITGYGSVNNGDLSNLVLEYSIQNSFGNALTLNANPTTITAGKNSSFTGTIDQLLPNTTYFVRAKGMIAGIPKYSNVVEFKTTPAFSQMLTFTKKKSKSVVLNTKITSNDDKGIQNIKVIYGTNPNDLANTIELSPNAVAPNESTTIVTLLENLLPDTTYYFKVKLTYNELENLSNVYSFTTLAGPSLYLNSYQPYFDRFSGYVQADEMVTNMMFQYGSQSFENAIPADPTSFGEGEGGLTQSSSVPVLNQNKTYYIRLKGDHDNSVLYSNVEVYNPYSAIVIAKENEQAISNNSVKINGLINTGGFTASNLRVIYGTSPSLLNSVVNFNPSTVMNYETNPIATEISGLDFNQTYYYRFVAQSETGKLTDYTSDLYSFSLSQLNTTESSSVNTLMIYPNPVSDYFKIEAKEQIKSVDVFDLQGRLIKSFNHSGRTLDNNFDIETLNSGVYLVSIELSSGKIIQKKIIKK